MNEAMVGRRDGAGWLFVAACLVASCGGETAEPVSSGQRAEAGGESVAAAPSPRPADRPVPDLRWTARIEPSASGSIVVMEGPCATGRCALAPVPIGEGNAHGLGMLDLAGPALPFDEEGLTPELESARLPAFVCGRTVENEGRRTSFFIIVLARDGIARVVLSEETPGHVSTLDTRTEPGPDALDIVFVRTAMPGPETPDADYRPGPPLTHRFRLTPEGYVRVGH